MRKIAVVCASGIGDALIFQIAACQLQRQGWDTTTCSNHFFGKWLQGFRFATQPSPEQVERIFEPFDAVFLQHDNSAKAKAIHALKKPVYTFYGSHRPEKHGPLREGFDFICDPERTMADNVAEALHLLFGCPRNKENGMKPLEGLVHRKHLRRVAIHPTSANPDKNWPRAKFLQLSELLEKEGFEPQFLAPSAERSLWPGPDLPDLETLASFIYESGTFIGNDSGPGHIASCLGIPHWILAQDEKQMRLWRPGWMKGGVLLPPQWLPRRLRQKYWGFFLSSRKVMNSFKKG